MFDFKSSERGYIKLDTPIKIGAPVNKKVLIEKNIISKSTYEGIYDLISTNNLSVRNLIKIGIIQNRARKLFDFLKLKEVIVISKYNKLSKVYNIEKFEKISIYEINDILDGYV